MPKMNSSIRIAGLFFLAAGLMGQSCDQIPLSLPKSGGSGGSGGVLGSMRASRISVVSTPEPTLDCCMAPKDDLAAITAPRLGTYAGGGLGIWAPAEIWKKDVELAKSLGIGIVRFNADGWDIFEPTRDNYDWKRLDMIVDIVRGGGLELLFTLPISSKWNGPKPEEMTGPKKVGSSHYPTKDMESFRGLAKAVASRYKGKIKYYEIWNEADFDLFWKGKSDPSEYFPFLKTGYEAIKAADPSAMVMMGGLAKPSDTRWFDILLQLGGGRYTDAVNLHIYPAFSTLADALDVNCKLLKKYGLSKPYWITETSNTGFYFETNDRGREESEKAVYLLQTYTRAFSHPDVERVFWHSLRNPGRDVRMSKDMDFALMTGEGQPLPAYEAHKLWTAKLAGAKPLGRQPDAAFEVYDFQRGRTRVRVLWKNQGRQPLTLPQGRDKAVVTPWGGDARELDGSSVSSVQVGQEPVFLEFTEK